MRPTVQMLLAILAVTQDSVLSCLPTFPGMIPDLLTLTISPEEHVDLFYGQSSCF